MDLGFFRRGLSDSADRSSVRLDYELLTASLQACQSASVTARTYAQSGAGKPANESSQDALVEILLGGPRWKEAIDEQGGSFNAARARKGGAGA